MHLVGLELTTSPSTFLLDRVVGAIWTRANLCTMISSKKPTLHSNKDWIP